MAIKGKGRSKSKPAARAPSARRYRCPSPFTQRRWVQRTAFFILGVLVVMRVRLADERPAEERRGVGGDRRGVLASGRPPRPTSPPWRTRWARSAVVSPGVAAGGVRRDGRHPAADETGHHAR